MENSYISNIMCYLLHLSYYIYKKPKTHLYCTKFDDFKMHNFLSVFIYI